MWVPGPDTTVVPGGVHEREFEMRKALGLLFAASLVVSVTAIAAGPAGAANTVLPTCKSLSGTQTFTPGLPIITSKAW